MDIPVWIDWLLIYLLIGAGLASALSERLAARPNPKTYFWVTVLFWWVWVAIFIFAVARGLYRRIRGRS